MPVAALSPVIDYPAYAPNLLGTAASHQQLSPNSNSTTLSDSAPMDFANDTDDSGSFEGEAPYVCNDCGKGFAIPARLQRHQRIHTGEKPYSCDFCDKTFSVKENLNVHRRIHTKERPYKCKKCDRAFEHSGKLRRHMRTHTGERPHKCEKCGKTFVQSGQLVIHMRAHTGEKPYTCDVCSKGFTCSKQLKVHIRTHTGEKPYKCDECGKTFGYNHVLKMHKMSHLGEKLYKCTLCDHFFNSRKALDSHIREHDDDDLSVVKPKRKASKSTKKGQTVTSEVETKTKSRKISGKCPSNNSNENSVPGMSSDDHESQSSDEDSIDSGFEGTPPPSEDPFICPSSSDTYQNNSLNTQLPTHNPVNVQIPQNNVPNNPFNYGTQDPSSNEQNVFSTPYQNSNLNLSQSISSIPDFNNCNIPEMTIFTTSTGEKVACPTKHVYFLQSSDKQQANLQYEMQQIEQNKKQREKEFLVTVQKVLEGLIDRTVLEQFGYPQCSIDDILKVILQVMNIPSCTDPSLALMDRIKVNLRKLLEGVVTDKNLWIVFGWRGKSIEEIISEFNQQCD